MTDRQTVAIGVDYKEQIWNGYFGIAPHYYIYNRRGELLEKRVNPHGVGQGNHKHYDNPRLIVDLLSKCGVFIARRMGKKSEQRLVEEMGIQAVVTTEKEPLAALHAYLADTDQIEP